MINTNDTKKTAIVCFIILIIIGIALICVWLLADQETALVITGILGLIGVPALIAFIYSSYSLYKSR